MKYGLDLIAGYHLYMQLDGKAYNMIMHGDQQAGGSHQNGLKYGDQQPDGGSFRSEYEPGGSWIPMYMQRWE